MALSTEDLGTGGSGLPKTISPGNKVLKINNIELEEFKFINDAYHLILHVETEPMIKDTMQVKLVELKLLNMHLLMVKPKQVLKFKEIDLF
jgi:hypothetical protein